MLSNPIKPISKNFSNIFDTTSPTSVANLLTPAPRSAAPKAPNRPLVPSLVSLPPAPDSPLRLLHWSLAACPGDSREPSGISC
jgi:hypothetical protein